MAFLGDGSALPALAVALVLGYALGSIPFGLVLTRLAGTKDIRAIGSGNIGATNVLRTGRKGLAAATLLCDMLKGTAAVLITHYFLGKDAALFGGLGAFLGHLFPVWLGFKGGKGVATYIGILAAFSWSIALGYGAIWIVTAFLTRYSSLSALVATVATPVLLWWFGYRAEMQLFVVLSVFIFVMHRANITRLFAGTESKIGQPAVTP
ncbi:MAG: glycerol-3-phosphate 1-O-acyltransferase PlsY [Pseudorhodoplanes sp.]|jgi:glycerol-3-phosphate acyltransferase PlsY|nr:glycerol-3-phosphate 1-O-acyltransferase PlsY [Pseudorhodoplanes sp.]